MTINVPSVNITGIEGKLITCECTVTTGIGFNIVGLSDETMKETLLRVVTALQSVGYHIPGKKITVTLPSGVNHNGIDLPIAISILGASAQEPFDQEELTKWIVFGELGLDASVRDVPGALQAIQEAVKRCKKGIILPTQSAFQIVEYIDDIPIYGVDNLEQAKDIILGDGTPSVQELLYQNQKGTLPQTNQKTWDVIFGNEGAKRAIEIAAAGGHNMILMGKTGGVQSALAHGMRQMLPQMPKEEILTNASILSSRSIYLQNASRRPLINIYASASLSSFTGKTQKGIVEPGAFSLANNGILTIEDINKLPKSVTEMLKNVIEDKKVVFSTLKSKVTIPAEFQLLAEMEPCPCGNLGTKKCTCTPEQKKAWWDRIILHPVYDRIDIQALVNPEPANGPMAHGELIQEPAKRVAAAIAIQERRFAGNTIRRNADMRQKDIDKYCPLSDECKQILEKLTERLGLSIRAYTKILLIARTIADLDSKKDIEPAHIAEAASMRFMDRSNP